LWVGRIGIHDAVAVAGGLGAAAAERAVERVFEEGQPEVLVSYGWAGALTCAVKPPTACIISEVVDAGSRERFATRSVEGFRLITLDHVARADEKRGLAAMHQSVLVDMEAAAVARMAAAQGIPFYCFKGVSDGYTDQLPDLSRFVGKDGELRVGAFLMHAAVRPTSWPSIARLGKNSREAARRLVNPLQQALQVLLEVVDARR
jgi:adenosylhomocysteine nucleosidase